MDFPILDNHLHLRADGRNVEALKDFYKRGGTHAVLSHLPYKEVSITSPEDFRSSYEITLSMADRANRETDVRVFVTLGPYPVLLIDLEEKYGIERAVEIMKRGMDIAKDFIDEGRAIALGEVGRPHFSVPERILQASNEIMRYGMELAAESGCPIVLHTETSTPEVMRELAGMADESGLSREKVIKHYCAPLIREEESAGLFPSVLAGKKALQQASEKGSRFLMETDYLDDPERPGAVMYPPTIPKRMEYLLEEGLLTEEDAWTIHKENPERVYGIEIGC